MQGLVIISTNVLSLNVQLLWGQDVGCIALRLISFVQWIMPEKYLVSICKSTQILLLFTGLIKKKNIGLIFHVMKNIFGKNAELFHRQFHLYWKPSLWPCVAIWHQSGGRLNIKMLSYQYRILMLNIRRSHDRLIFNMGIPIPGKGGLYIEMGPRSLFIQGMSVKTSSFYFIASTQQQQPPGLSDEQIRASLLSAVEDKMRRRLKEIFSQAQVSGARDDVWNLY